MYEYRLEVRRVVDGDTVHARVDLGCDVRLDLTLRLAGIDAPELPTVEGVAAKEYLEGLLEPSPRVPATLLVRTFKDRREKYGRYLGQIIWRFGDGHEADVNKAMLNAGHAQPWP
jgi:endonuclease YncB( thermonuclease family)